MMKENSNNDIQVDEHVYEVPHVERVEAQSERGASPLLRVCRITVSA